MTLIPEHMDLSVENPKQGPLPLYVGMYELDSTPLHFHDHVEFSLVIQGSGTETVNGKTHRLRPGVASFMLPNHMHCVRSDSGQRLLKYCCTFDINILLNTSYASDWCEPLYQIGSRLPSSAELSPDEAKWLCDIFQKLMLESGPSSGTGRDSIICAMLLEGVLRFIRAVGKLQTAGTHPATFASKQPIWRVLQYLHAHYRDSVSLEELSRHFNVSVSYISRLFKQHMGITFLDYLHQLRIESAANLLISTQMSIIDIAAQSGFESVRTFTRVFQNEKGATPSEFRSMMLKARDKEK